MKRWGMTAGTMAASATMLAGCKASTVATAPAQAGPAQAVPTVPSEAAVPPSAAQTVADARVGGAIDLDGDDVSQKIRVAVVKVVDPDSPSNEFERAPSGDHLVSVQFQVLNEGTAVYQDDPFVDISAKDSAGQTMQQNVVTGTVAGTQLPSAMDLVPGDESLGYETFNVPNGDSIVQVQYASYGGLNGGVGQWQVK